MTTKEDIRQWLEQGKERKATHVIVVCDTFDHEDYPVYVFGNVREKYAEYDRQNMQKVMEVYNLAMDLNEQLESGKRVFNF